MTARRRTAAESRAWRNHREGLGHDPYLCRYPVCVAWAVQHPAPTKVTYLAANHHWKTAPIWEGKPRYWLAKHNDEACPCTLVEGESQPLRFATERSKD